MNALEKYAAKQLLTQELVKVANAAGLWAGVKSGLKSMGTRIGQTKLPASLAPHLSNAKNVGQGYRVLAGRAARNPGKTMAIAGTAGLGAFGLGRLSKN